MRCEFVSCPLTAIPILSFPHTQVESLKNEKCSLLTRCESLEKDLERIKRETEKAKVRVEDRGVQTDFHISSHEESASTSSGASNSGRRTDFGTQQHETQDIPKIGQETSNLQTYR